MPMAHLHLPASVPRPEALGPLGGMQAVRQLCEAVLRAAGWLVMLQLGAAMSWSWFGGLLPVVVWWLWQVWDPLRPRAMTRPMAWGLALGAVAGVWLVLRSGPEGWWGWPGLGLATAAWAQACRAFMPRPADPRSTDSASHVLMQLMAWLFAAWCLADPLAWQTRWVWLVPVWLVWTLCAQPAQLPGGSAGAARQVQARFAMDPVMAVMMASLLWMGQWCAVAGWGPVQTMVAHGAVMVLAHTAASRACRSGSPRHMRSFWGVGMVLTALGAATVCLTADWTAMLCAMSLVSAGSACRPAWAPVSPSARLLALWAAGAALAMGAAAPVYGPTAIGIALVLTAGAELVRGWRERLAWSSATTGPGSDQPHRSRT